MQDNQAKSFVQQYWMWGVGILLALIVMGSYNGHVGRDEATKKQWSEVTNQYQRRADLIPNLVEVVKGYAGHENATLRQVAEARASATSFKITPEVLNDPQALAKFQEVQGSLSQALSRLMMVTEQYPNLKADKNFLELQAQLEGTENRITVARKRYIDSVNDYNVGVRSLPFGKLSAALGGFEVKPNFQVENEAAISTAPKINFGNQAPVQANKPVPAYNQ